MKVLSNCLNKNSGKYSYLLCILSGLILPATALPFFLAPLVFVAFIPLLFVIENTKSSKRIFINLLLSFFILHLTAEQGVFFVPFGLSSMVLILIMFIIFSFLMTIPFLLYKWTKEKIKHNLIAWLSLPVYWVAYEILYNDFELSLGAYKLGNLLYQFPPIIHFYAYTGQSGGSFIIILTNMVLFQLFKNWGIIQKRKSLLRFSGIIIIGIAALNFLTLINNHTAKHKEKIKVALVQPSFDPYQKSTPEILNDRFKKLERLSLSVKTENVDLIVWHEAALQEQIVINDLENDPYIKAVKEISKEVNAPVLTGLTAFELFADKAHAHFDSRAVGDGRYFDTYNAAMLVSYDQPTQLQFKFMLLPFIERVPFLNHFSFLEKLHVDIGKSYPSFRKVDNPTVLKYKNMKIAPVICNEALYPDYVRNFIRKEANMIAVISNDAWTGKHFGYLQMAYFSVPLAIALAKPVVRASNAGSSLFIDKSGQISKMTRFGEEKVIINEVYLDKEQTFYTKHGNIIGKLSVFASGILILLSFVRSMKKSKR